MNTKSLITLYLVISLNFIFSDLINYNLNLVENVTFENASNNFGISDVWGYTDEHGIEYAIIGYQYGTSILDVSSTPGESIEVANFIGPSTGDYYFHRDYKTYGDFLYIVNEMYGGDVGMQVIDLSPLPEESPVQLNTYNLISQSHNLWVDDSGYAFIEHQTGDNIHIVNLLNPSIPTYEGSFNSFASNCHDIFTRDGVAYVSEGYSNRFGIYDLSNLNNISEPLAVIPCEGYAHNAWLNDAGTHIITTEETANKTIKIWDITNLNNITLSGEFLGENNLAHNVHVLNDLVYISHYTTGIKIIDIYNPERPVEVAAYDTYLLDDDSGFYGCWGAYPFTNNTYVYASDMQYGLYVFEFNEIQAGFVNGYIYFNGEIPLANSTIKSSLNNKTFYTDENGFYDFGFPSGPHEFIVNNEHLIQMDIIPRESHNINHYLEEEFSLGDVNQDTVINVLDILLIINFIMETSTPSPQQFWSSDLNEDSIINIQDIILLIQLILN